MSSGHYIDRPDDCEIFMMIINGSLISYAIIIVTKSKFGCGLKGPNSLQNSKTFNHHKFVTIGSL